MRIKSQQPEHDKVKGFSGPTGNSQESNESHEPSAPYPDPDPDPRTLPMALAVPFTGSSKKNSESALLVGRNNDSTVWEMENKESEVNNSQASSVSYFTPDFVSFQAYRFTKCDENKDSRTGHGLRTQPRKLVGKLTFLTRGDINGLKEILSLLKDGDKCKSYKSVYASILDDIKMRVKADLAGPFHDHFTKNSKSCGQPKQSHEGYGAIQNTDPTAPFFHSASESFGSNIFFDKYFVRTQMQKIAERNDQPANTNDWTDVDSCIALEYALLSLQRVGRSNSGNHLSLSTNFRELMSNLIMRSNSSSNKFYRTAYKSILADVEQYVKADKSGEFYELLVKREEDGAQLRRDECGYAIKAILCTVSCPPFYACPLLWCCLPCNDCSGNYNTEQAVFAPVNTIGLFCTKSDVAHRELMEMGRTFDQYDVNAVNNAGYQSPYCCC